MLQTEGRSETFIKKRSGLERVYFRVIEWGTYLALFTPLILVKSYFFPYVVPKTIFFRIIVDIIFIAYILLVISNPRYRPRINALTLAITVFLGVIIIASLVGANFEKSFWSVFERMTGLLTFFHLYAFFIVLTNVFRERKYWERILTISILIGIALSFYVFTSSEPTARGGGTLGNTSFMSAYILFDIFFAISLFLIKSGGWRIFYGVALIPLLRLLLFPPQESTQGAIGAFWGGISLLGFSCLLFYLFTSGKKLFKKIAFAAIILLVLAGIGFTQTDFFKDKLTEIKQSSSWEARAVVWKMGFHAWQERPWLGWGEDNFNLAFAKYFDPKLPITGDIWYDRVHNIVLDMLVQAGILGFLSYLAIFGVAIFSLLKISQKVVEKKNLFLPLGMMALLATYFAQDIWVFDMVSSYMMFFLTLAFICFLIQDRRQEMILQGQERVDEDKSSSSPFAIARVREKRVSPFFGGLLIILALFTLYFGNIQPARASHYTVMGISQPLKQAIPAFQKAIKISPMSIFETPEQFSRRVTDLIFDENVDKGLLEEGFKLAEEELKKSIAHNPQDFRLYLVLGRQYNDFYQLTRNEEALRQADETLEKARELSPKNQQVYWSLAQTKLSLGLEKEAIEYMQKSVDLDPNFSQSRWYLAMTYRAIGDDESALKEIEAAEKAGFNWRNDLENLKKVIETYQNLQKNEELVPLYLLAIQLDPKNAQFPAGLAVAYANLRQFDKARQYAEEALSLNPDFAAELEEFLKSLPK